MNAAIITVGNEILMGRTINTNLSDLASRLVSLGIDVQIEVTVKDDADQIINAISAFWQKYDVVITTGGLGPTSDDITRVTVAKFFHKELIFQESIWQKIRTMLAERERPITENNKVQAFVPENFTPLENDFGTAPGLFYEENGTYLFMFPGVPFEMNHLCEKHLLPFFTKKSAQQLHVQDLRTYELGESQLAEMIADIRIPADVTLAFLPQPGRVDLRLWSTNEESLAATTSAMRNVLREYLWTELPVSPAKQLLSVLGTATIATAESCTGGLIAKFITDIPGASANFLGSVVSYANEVKINLLQVDPKIIAEFGAVSEQCVQQMSENLKNLFNCNLSLAVSGIAGPDGGSPEKPAGTVHMAVNYRGKTHLFQRRFFGSRERIRIMAAEFLLIKTIFIVQGK